MSSHWRQESSKNRDQLFSLLGKYFHSAQKIHFMNLVRFLPTSDDQHEVREIILKGFKSISLSPQNP